MMTCATNFPIKGMGLLLTGTYFPLGMYQGSKFSICFCC